MDKEKIQNLIKDLIEKTTIEIKSISIDENKPKHPNSNNRGDQDTTWYSVEVENPRYFLDFGGEALFALNHLARKIIERNNNQGNEGEPNFAHKAVLIDVNGFQKKRVENIYAIAHMMAERARYFKSSIEVDPMTAFERRLVHEFLSNAEDLETESTGEGRERRVVIKYTGKL